MRRTGCSTWAFCLISGRSSNIYRSGARHCYSRQQCPMISVGWPARYCNPPVTVQVNHSTPASTVAHALYPVDQHLKTALLELLRHTDTESVLIFTRTKHRAKRVGQQLEKAGYRAASLQGNLSQNKRQAALNGFRDGSYQVLVATDIAARGIDVSLISHVINYDIPDTTDAYTHRIGRTGRAAKTGDAFTFVTREDEDTVRGIERVLGEKIERRTLKGFDYKNPHRRGTASLPARRANRSAAGSRRNRNHSGLVQPPLDRRKVTMSNRHAGLLTGVPLLSAPLIQRHSRTGGTNPSPAAETHLLKVSNNDRAMQTIV